MKLIKPPVPAEYLWAMRSGLPEFVDPDDAAAAVFLQNHHAYEVFSLDVVKFASTKKLQKSVSSLGWRFMTLDPAGDMGCHVGGSTSPKLLSIARTPDVTSRSTVSVNWRSGFSVPPGNGRRLRISPGTSNCAGSEFRRC